MPQSKIATHIDATWLQSVPLRKLFAAFDAANIEARIVGGAVRNALLGQPVSDIDLATPAIPDVVKQLARNAGLAVYPTGIAHGTVTVVVDGQAFEVTTLRRDVETDGRRATVAFTEDWSEDARRRDFTINALFASADGTVHDPVGGLADLAKRRVRFIGTPEDRIREDYLRILRFFRFSGNYAEGPLDADGLAAAANLKDGIAQLSAERIWSELKKLLITPRASEILAVMDAHGILAVALGGDANATHFAHLVAIEDALSEPADAITRLAALAVTERRSPREIGAHLRLSRTEEIALSGASVAVAGISPDASETIARAAIYRLSQDAFKRALRVAWARSGAAATDAAWAARAALAAAWSPPTMPFSGSDILALGIAPGPDVGRILNAFEDWWIAAGFPADEALLRRQLAAQVHLG